MRRRCVVMVMFVAAFLSKEWASTEDGKHGKNCYSGIEKDGVGAREFSSEMEKSPGKHENAEECDDSEDGVLPFDFSAHTCFFSILICLCEAICSVRSENKAGREADVVSPTLENDVVIVILHVVVIGDKAAAHFVDA